MYLALKKDTPKHGLSTNPIIFKNRLLKLIEAANKIEDSENKPSEGSGNDIVKKISSLKKFYDIENNSIKQIIIDECAQSIRDCKSLVPFSLLNLVAANSSEFAKAIMKKHSDSFALGLKKMLCVAVFTFHADLFELSKGLMLETDCDFNFEVEYLDEANNIRQTLPFIECAMQYSENHCQTLNLLGLPGVKVDKTKVLEYVNHIYDQAFENNDISTLLAIIDFGITMKPGYDLKLIGYLMDNAVSTESVFMIIKKLNLKPSNLTPLKSKFEQRIEHLHEFNKNNLNADEGTRQLWLKEFFIVFDIISFIPEAKVNTTQVVGENLSSDTQLADDSEA